MKPTMFERGADASRLREELAITPIGGVATYVRMSNAIGKPVSGATGALTSARRIAQREDGLVFGCIRNMGLKRLDGEGIVNLAGAQTQSVRRRARRVVNTLALAAIKDLREGSQRRAVAIASVLLVVADLAQEKSIRQVEHAASGRAASLPIAETLLALGLVIKPKEGGEMS
jgi:hypothetical protein